MSEEKLKTLKDFAILAYPKKYKKKFERFWISETELKQEAIKRVKLCNGPVDFTRNDRCGKALDRFPYNYCEVCQREIWFNNLTKEDLK